MICDRMFALCKKDEEVRPVAVVNTMRRLAAKPGIKSISAAIREAGCSVQLEGSLSKVEVRLQLAVFSQRLHTGG